MTTRRTVSSEQYDRYDIVVVPFPSSDQLAEKRRPALVISGPALAQYGLLWIAMITSASNSPWNCDVPIGNLSRAGLPAPSVVRPAKIACIEHSRIVRRAGRLDPSVARKVADQLTAFFDRTTRSSQRG